MTTNIKRPNRKNLDRKASVLDYEFTDVLDASTPEELHTASYGFLLRRMMEKSWWREVSTKTLLVSPIGNFPIEEMIWKVEKMPENVHRRTLLGRTISPEGVVVRKTFIHFISNLSMASAAYLSVTHSPAPVIWCEGRDNWKGIALPSTGSSYDVDLLDPDKIASVLRDSLLEVASPGKDSDLAGVIRSYGFNRIPAFKRSFEVARLVPKDEHP